MAHNLCYTTLLDKSTIDRLGLKKDEDYIQTPNDGLCSMLISWDFQSNIIQLIDRCFHYLQKTERVTSNHFGRLDCCP
jgi:hypothetical protein